MSDDIVAELDRWLEAHATGWQKTRPLVQRARDEIVALREGRAYTREEMREATAQNYRAGRAEALEEARRCTAGFKLAAPHPIGPAFGAGWDTAVQKIAEAIEALKGAI